MLFDFKWPDDDGVLESGGVINSTLLHLRSSLRKINSQDLKITGGKKMARSIDAEKAFDETQQLFMIEKVTKLKNRSEPLNVAKGL